MNEDTKLECLRLAIDDVNTSAQDTLKTAKQFYEWVTSENKPNTIKYEKVLKERE